MKKLVNLTSASACYSPAPGLDLTGTCIDVPRSLNMLSGALKSCRVDVLARSVDSDGSGQLEFEFTRAHCVEVYCMLIAVGVELDRDSHLRLTACCQCTRERHAQCALDRTEMTLRLREPAFTPGSAFDEMDWLLDESSRVIYEA